MGIGNFVKRAGKKVVGTVKRAVKKVGDVFKRVINNIPAIAKIAIMVVAAYFTFGVALSYFPAANGVLASMPGFGATASGNAGIFSSFAQNLGVAGKGITDTALAGTQAAASAGAQVAATGAEKALEVGATSSAQGTVGVGGELGKQVGGQLAKNAGQEVVKATTNQVVKEVGSKGVMEAVKSAGQKVAGSWGNLDTTSKWIAASTGLQVASSMMAKSPDPYSRGTFYGANKKGPVEGFTDHSKVSHEGGSPYGGDPMPALPPTMVDNGVQKMAKPEVNKFG